MLSFRIKNKGMIMDLFGIFHHVALSIQGEEVVAYKRDTISVGDANIRPCRPNCRDPSGLGGWKDSLLVDKLVVIIDHLLVEIIDEK